MGKTLFVSCGATVPFPRLIEIVVSEPFLVELTNLQYSRIILQYGKGYTAAFQTLLDSLGSSKIEVREEKHPSTTIQDSVFVTDSSILHRSLNVNDVAVEVIGIEFLSNIQDIITNYTDLIISHSGTGSILDALRLHKPLIAVVNDSLMDNHQLQIAQKFEALNYLWSCSSPNLPDLIDRLQRSTAETKATFPNTYNTDFQNLLLDLANK
ncbi:hypothetical protein TPHA_0K01930 [Tetrapisispora phaffii CBS 4417]|uniref:UDP-N-acetylglucosamine transferase subunit ALG13 n=1 Tax=Tetrapisispora phaffii (strain ATCC 24235 / CBS 4417 / NBRC 1672 / NRRL Y-8282 / UCD 70-5) TaxID=1071381 RepID=G8BZJ8_TETPH|nr:hypothetical protein TPHA_0K01930 [Tetrapisispora phaffii CBS 4417]CCE65326.1 hypothetical protein TPHA_0K01930 [Tetrapisispora phaffii CBS 4417]